MRAVALGRVAMVDILIEMGFKKRLLNLAGVCWFDFGDSFSYLVRA